MQPQAQTTTSNRHRGAVPGAAHAAATKFQQHTVKGIHYKQGIITQRKAGGVQQRPVIREGGKTVGARTTSKR
jgi:hypothetical protein